ncbi:helical backbone metal receptor [Chitinophagaceae bacterium MMS25-I14]
MSSRQTFTDMLGRMVDIAFPPLRIVSLVPSQTELLYDLGLDAAVVGITKFCVHPESWFRSKQRVGGTKQVHYDIIAALKPDLILANKEENTQEIVETLAKTYPVWVSDIHDLNGALEMIYHVGQLTGKETEARKTSHEIISGFNGLPKAKTAKRIAYLIWRNPWMTVGYDTFISNMITTIGWENVFAGKARYPEISLEELAAATPDIILLSSEPYPFKEKHIEEIRTVLPHAVIMLVDGEMFSWYGSRLKLAAGYFDILIKKVPQ